MPRVPESQPVVPFILAVKVMPSAPVNRLIGFRGDTLVVKIASPPEKGKANKELIGFLARLLGIARNEIELLRGAASPHKLLRLPPSCRERLARVLKAL
jgi:uncharacterized protein (TIGR00251 family)